MGERHFPGVMDGKLHLDPEFSEAWQPAATAAPAPAPAVGVDLGLDDPHQVDLSGGLPPSLNPQAMGDVYGHYAPDLDQELDQKLELSSGFPGPARKSAPGKWGMNDAGYGTTVHGVPVGGKPTMSTSDQLDNVNSRDRAARQDRDAADAKQRGETVPNPVVDEVKGPGGSP